MVVRVRCKPRGIDGCRGEGTRRNRGARSSDPHEEPGAAANRKQDEPHSRGIDKPNAPDNALALTTLDRPRPKQTVASGRETDVDCVLTVYRSRSVLELFFDLFAPLAALLLDDANESVVVALGLEQVVIGDLR